MIQACIPAISSLRFFHEKRPGLHLVAAGSLLEFALKEIPSFGVGRIENIFMYPLSFDESLLAMGREQLFDIKSHCNSESPLADALHVSLIDYIKQFLLLGGLPEMAGMVYMVRHTAANGIPLGAEVNPKRYKIILFDHGIFQRILGLNLSEHLISDDFTVINKGNLAEQFVGTELIKNSFKSTRPQLHYWHRESRGSNAEVDYLIQKENDILPIEVKSGAQGKMQSMRIFLFTRFTRYKTYFTNKC